MTSRMLRSLIAVLALNFAFAAVGVGQTAHPTAWELAGLRLSLGQTIEVVTIKHPDRRQRCVVNSVNANEIVCTHHGDTIVYQAQDVMALIKPGNHPHVLLWFAGVLAAGGAATWGTIVLTAVCPVCAVGTAVVALGLYVMAPMTGMLADDGDYPEELLYLAPGQTLQVKLH